MPVYSEIFRILGDPLRLRVMHLLVKADTPLCVCELVDSLEAPEYAVSRVLKQLKQAGLIEGRREGKWVYHWPAKPRDAFGRNLLPMVGSLKGRPFERDLREFRKRLALREGGKCLTGIQKRYLAASSSKGPS